MIDFQWPANQLETGGKYWEFHVAARPVEPKSQSWECGDNPRPKCSSMMYAKNLISHVAERLCCNHLYRATDRFPCESARKRWLGSLHFWTMIGLATDILACLTILVQSPTILFVGSFWIMMNADDIKAWWGFAKMRLLLKWLSGCHIWYDDFCWRLGSWNPGRLATCQFVWWKLQSFCVFCPCCTCISAKTWRYIISHLIIVLGSC